MWEDFLKTHSPLCTCVRHLWSQAPGVVQVMCGVVEAALPGPCPTSIATGRTSLGFGGVSCVMDITWETLGIFNWQEPVGAAEL